MLAKQEKSKSPLHLRLTNLDWLECFKQLSRAELGVFYYIRTLDPYGDRSLEIDCKFVAEILEIHRTSVSRALEELSKKGLIDLEITKATVRQKINNRRLTLLTGQDNQSNMSQKGEKETCASTQPICMNAQPSALMQIDVHGCTAKCADAQPDIYIDRARALKTLNTNSDLNIQEACAEEKKFSEATPSRVVEPMEPNQSVANQQTDIYSDTSTAAPNSPPRENYIHPTQKCDDRFNRKIHPWRKSDKRNDFDKGFIDYLTKTYLPKTPHYQKLGLPLEKGCAFDWINERERNEQGLSKLETRWEEYKTSLKPTEKRVSRSISEYDVWSKTFCEMTRADHQMLIGRLMSLGEPAFLEHHRYAFQYLRDMKFRKPELYKELTENASTSA